MFTTSPTAPEIVDYLKLKEETAQKRKKRLDDLDSAFDSIDAVIDSHNNAIQCMEERIGKAAKDFEDALKRNEAKHAKREIPIQKIMPIITNSPKTAREFKKPIPKAPKTPAKSSKPKAKTPASKNKKAKEKPSKEFQQPPAKTSKKKENVAALIRRTFSSLARTSRSKQPQSKKASKKKESKEKKASKGKKASKEKKASKKQKSAAAKKGGRKTSSKPKKPIKATKHILTGNVVDNNGNR